MYHVYLIWASELTSWFFLTFGFVLGGTYSRLHCIVLIWKDFELETWFLPRFPAPFFPFGAFWAGFCWPPSDRIYFSCKR